MESSKSSAAGVQPWRTTTRGIGLSGESRLFSLFLLVSFSLSFGISSSGPVYLHLEGTQLCCEAVVEEISSRVSVSSLTALCVDDAFFGSLEGIQPSLLAFVV